MESAERETVIVINDADLEEGFFRISTSKKQVYETFLKRIGPDDVVSTKVSRTVDGCFTEGSIRCKAHRLGSLKIIVKPTSHHCPTDQERAIRTARGKALAAASLAKRQKEKM